jgi:nicotinamide mononucleotide transporter
VGESEPPEAPPARRAVGVRAAGGLFVLATIGLVAGRAAAWVPFSWLEIVGAITGAACVLLVVARSVWNFPVGIASCVAYLVFFYEGRLYADAGLQVVFILLGVHGWVAWVRGRAETTAVRRVPLGELIALAVAFPIVWLGLVQLLVYVGGAAPPFDGFVTALSLAAQWLLNRRYVENWLGWIVVDQVSVVLFWSRDMHLTAGLYALFLGMCVAGLVEWRRHLGGARP